jgi:hypothetical protein
MKSKEQKKQITIIGKFNEVSSFLKDCEKKYVYVSELIEAMKAEELKKSFIN